MSLSLVRNFKMGSKKGIISQNNGIDFFPLPLTHFPFSFFPYPNGVFWRWRGSISMDASTHTTQL
jgi:hypothetical protein